MKYLFSETEYDNYLRLKEIDNERLETIRNQQEIIDAQKELLQAALEQIANSEPRNSKLADVSPNAPLDSEYYKLALAQGDDLVYMTIWERGTSKYLPLHYTDSQGKAFRLNHIHPSAFYERAHSCSRDSYACYTEMPAAPDKGIELAISMFETTHDELMQARDYPEPIQERAEVPVDFEGHTLAQAPKNYESYACNHCRARFKLPSCFMREGRAFHSACNEPSQVEFLLSKGNNVIIGEYTKDGQYK